MNQATSNPPTVPSTGDTSQLYQERASEAFELLGLSVAGQHLDTTSQRAAAENWTYTHFLGYLLDGELQERHRKRVLLNLQFAKFPFIKRLSEFDLGKFRFHCSLTNAVQLGDAYDPIGCACAACDRN